MPSVGEQRPERIGDAWPLRLGDREEMARDRLAHAVGAQPLHQRKGLAQRFGRGAGFGDDQEPGLRQVHDLHALDQRQRIEIVIEAQPRAVLLADPVIAGDEPAAELGERLSAKARAAGAEQHQRAGAGNQPVISGARFGDVGWSHRECGYAAGCAPRLGLQRARIAA